LPRNRTGLIVLTDSVISSTRSGLHRHAASRVIEDFSGLQVEFDDQLIRMEFLLDAQRQHFVLSESLQGHGGKPRAPALNVLMSLKA
jgi:hypothetical protein